MAKLLAALSTYIIPEILSIEGKKCHEVIDEKGRLTRDDSLQEGQHWANFHHGHKEQAEDQSHISSFSHALLSTWENKWAYPVA